MPITEEHKKKKYKNFALLFALIGFIALFFIMTMVKLKGLT